MKKLIVVANDLERSGKSGLARAIAAHFSQNEIDHTLFTSDEMDMVESFEGEFWDLEDHFDPDSVMAAFEENEALVFDVHTGAARIWGDLCEENELDTMLAEIDAEMTLVVPNTGSERCNEEMLDLIDIYSDSCDYVVCHLPINESSSFEWEGSAAAKAMRNLGAVELEVSGLSAEMETAIANTNEDFVSVLNKPEALPRFAEVQVCQWLESVGSSLEEASDYLVPDVVGEVVLDY